MDIPPEIWSLVADELLYDASSNLHRRKSGAWHTPRLSCRYMGINRFFYALYLSLKYGEVVWRKLDERLLYELRELQKPTVAGHVRRLVVSSWFIDYLVKRDRTLPPPSQASVPEAFGFVSTLEALQSALTSLIWTPLPAGKMPVSASTSSDSVLQLMTNAIPNMRNVVAYRFELRDMNLTTQTQGFLRAAQLPFGGNLRKLAVQTTIFNFGALLDFAGLENLDEIELHFDYTSHGSSDAAAVSTLAQREALALERNIIPFIKSRKNVLRSLIIASYSSLDLSPFFRSIGPFPSLRVLSLHILLDESHLSDVDALIDFLRLVTSSLTHLEIRPGTPEASPGEQIGLTGWSQNTPCQNRRRRSYLRVQIALVRNPDILQSLQGLHLPVGNFEWCFHLIKRTSRSLTHLSLSDHLFASSDNKLLELLDIFASNPFKVVSLLLHVQTLSTDLIKLLARKLPGLQSLVLIFEDFFRYRGVAGHIVNYSAEPDADFLSEMKKIEVGELDWYLQHICVVGQRYGLPFSPEDATLVGVPPSIAKTNRCYSYDIAQRIPSIKSYGAVQFHRDVFMH